ncbi:hypothetical protein K4L44_04730 [Halosquirtibacter laminarini]|uniref:Uncharacterized protein n=1 Tax=Halosquirtibacter laminarini TaxID=3374600 RepID=A0AC61NP91_9BACT|nr:hypothetical protein K4L44_04730 [Prolixibacteraceae bacterium]
MIGPHCPLDQNKIYNPIPIKENMEAQAVSFPNRGKNIIKTLFESTKDVSTPMLSNSSN